MLGLFGETYSVYGMSALLGERANNYMTANKFVETKDNVISGHLRQVKKKYKIFNLDPLRWQLIKEEYCVSWRGHFFGS